MLSAGDVQDITGVTMSDLIGDDKWKTAIAGDALLLIDGLVTYWTVTDIENIGSNKPPTKPPHTANFWYRYSKPEGEFVSIAPMLKERT
jgi:hypothetical protein